MESDSSESGGAGKTAPASEWFDASQDVGVLYRRYRDGLRAYVARTFGSGPPDPEDVVHVVFEKYAAVINSKHILNPKAFLFVSARNYVIDQRRRQAVRAEFAKDAQNLADNTDELHAERVLESKQRWAAIEAAIEQLDSRSREMLLMSRIHGLSSAEIARRHGCSATLVKNIIARALVACHRALQPND